MNQKEEELHKIVEIVVDCCSTTDENGNKSITKADVLGKSRTENITLTRCIATRMIVFAGYTVSTVSKLLKRTPRAVRDMIRQGQRLTKSSRAYRIAENEAMLKCRQQGLQV